MYAHHISVSINIFASIQEWFQTTLAVLFVNAFYFEIDIDMSLGELPFC